MATSLPVPRRRPATAAVLGALALGLLALGVAGCATFPAGYETLSLASFEALPDSSPSQAMMIRLDGDSEIVLVRPGEPPPAAVGSWPLADSLGYRFLVSPAAPPVSAWTSGEFGSGVPAASSAHPHPTLSPPLISCTPAFQLSGGGGFLLPGLPNPVTGETSGGSWVSTPGQPITVHQGEPLLKCDAIENADGYVLCHCSQPAYDLAGRSYFCRNPGYERLLEKAPSLVHPGYSILDGDFSVIVPKDRILSLARPLPLAEAADAAAPGDSALSLPARSSTPHRGFADAFTGDPQDYADFVAASAGQRLARSYTGLEELTDRCSTHFAAAIALALALEEQEEKAIKALEKSIEARGQGYWFRHDEAQDPCSVLLLLRLARGEIAEAVVAAGHLLHLERPDWFFGDEPLLFLPVEQPSLLASFLARKEASLRAQWPRFVAALKERLDGTEPGRESASGVGAAPPAGSTITSAPPEPAGAEDLGRRLDAQIARALGRGLFQRGADAAELETLLNRALALHPDDPGLRRCAVSIALARYGGAVDRLASASRHADTLLSLDAVAGHRARAAVREEAGDHAGAEADWRRAIELDPGDPEHRYGLGFFLQRSRQYAKAFAAFAAIAAADSGQAEADYQYARTAVLARDRAEEGITRLRRYLASRPAPSAERAAWAQVRLGRLHALAGQAEPAQKAFEAALELDPGLWQAEAFRQAMRRQDSDDRTPR